jgi:hypothetical protein
MLPRIKKIISVAPYTLVCEWTNGEIRAIQMEEKLKEWAGEPNSIYKRLLDKAIFIKVKLDTASKTIFWDNLIKMKDTDGTFFSAPLDLDPDVLYQMSVPVNKTKNPDNIAA